METEVEIECTAMKRCTEPQLLCKDVTKYTDMFRVLSLGSNLIDTFVEQDVFEIGNDVWAREFCLFRSSSTEETCKFRNPLSSSCQAHIAI